MGSPYPAIHDKWSLVFRYFGTILVLKTAVKPLIYTYVFKKNKSLLYLLGYLEVRLSCQELAAATTAGGSWQG